MASDGAPEEQTTIRDAIWGTIKSTVSAPEAGLPQQSELRYLQPGGSEEAERQSPVGANARLVRFFGWWRREDSNP